MKNLTTLLALLFLVQSSFIYAQKNKPVYLQHVSDNDLLKNIEHKFDRFKHQIMGHFSNARQVKEHPELGEVHQEFIITPIFHDRPNEFWIYLEFFSPEMPDKPLDQRVEQYVRVNRDSIRMEVYYLKEPQKYINEWKKPHPFQGLTKNDLVVRDATCDLFIVENIDKPHVHETVMPSEIECSLKVSTGAAKYVVLWFGLSDKGYQMQFKFFDINKKALRQGHVLEFDRLDYRTPGYVNHAPGVKIDKKAAHPVSNTVHK